MYRLGPCIPIFRVFFIKSAKRMGICEYVIFGIDTYKKCVFKFEKGYKQVNAPGTPKTYCWYTNADLQVYQYLLLYMKMTC